MQCIMGLQFVSAWWGNFPPVKGWSMVMDTHGAQGYVLGYRVKQVLPKA